MTIGEFRLERWFAAWEFTAQHLLSASDCETMTVGELLEIAGVPVSELLDLRLGYSHSQGDPALRGLIARFYSAHSADDIVVTNAPEEAIFLTMQALLRVGDRVVVQTPCYQSLSELPVHQGCDVRPWPLIETNTSWRMDLDHLADLLTDETRLLVINTPHNPTGHLPNITEFETILGLCAERGIWLLCDEMYRGLEHQRSSRLPAASQRYERAISLWGMSKSFGLPGLRIGWLALQDRDLLESLVRVKDYTTICSSGPGQLLARIALERAGALFARNLEIVQANLGKIKEFMAHFREVFAWREPMGGPVAFSRLRKGGAKAFCDAAVAEQGILLVPSSVFDFGDSHIRWGLGRRGFSDGLVALEAHMRGRPSLHRLMPPS
jgi:aspartate/methionine/tyrosine aminotransferase